MRVDDETTGRATAERKLPACVFFVLVGDSRSLEGLACHVASTYPIFDLPVGALLLHSPLKKIEVPRGFVALTNAKIESSLVSFIGQNASPCDAERVVEESRAMFPSPLLLLQRHTPAKTMLWQ